MARVAPTKHTNPSSIEQLIPFKIIYKTQIPLSLQLIAEIAEIMYNCKLQGHTQLSITVNCRNYVSNSMMIATN